MTQQDKDRQAELARHYREAAEGDAWHQLSGGGGDAPRGKDPTLVVTPEVPDVPLTDVAHPDKADGEDHDAPPHPDGPYHDAIMRGLEPGETSVE